MIVRRANVYFCPDVQKVFEYAAEVHPTIMIGSPRVWEKLQAGLQAVLAANPNVEHGALLARVGLDACRLGVTGAAPISPSVIEFFRSLGLPLVEGYGMTESTVGATMNQIGNERIGTVGKPNAGLELKVAEDGELLLRGGNVMQGYYKDPDGTANAVDADGWLHTGDVASIDAEGYVRIVDRKKELIITAGGKNVSPANMEGLLKRNPLIGQVAVIGDRRPFIAALIVLDPDAARVWAARHGLTDASFAELASRSGRASRGAGGCGRGEYRSVACRAGAQVPLAADRVDGRVR